MTNRMDDQFGVARLVENQIGVMRRIAGSLVRVPMNGYCVSSSITLWMRACTRLAPCGERAAM